MSGLTPKQESFCQAFIETGNASEAYRQVYNTKKMKLETVHRSAKELMDNPKIAARVDEINAEHRDRHDVTVDSLTDELEIARDLAVGIESPAAAVSATMGKARLHGLLTEKHEHTGKDGKDLVPEMSANEAGRRLAFIFAQALNAKTKSESDTGDNNDD